MARQNDVDPFWCCDPATQHVHYPVLGRPADDLASELVVEVIAVGEVGNET